MTNVTPIQQPPIEDLRNCLQIAQDWSRCELSAPDTAQVFASIARLIRHALEQLSEPNLAAIQATEILVREWHGSLEEHQNARDVAAGILRAAVTGEIPRTWETK